MADNAPPVGQGGAGQAAPPLPANDPRVQERLQVLQAAFEANELRMRVDQAARNEFARLHPNAPVGAYAQAAQAAAHNAHAALQNLDPANAQALAEALAAARAALVPPAAVAPAPAPAAARAPFYPPPEKWSGELTRTDSRNQEIAFTGRAWMLSFEAYVGSYQLDPLVSFMHFLKDRALEWWYQLAAEMTPNPAAFTWQHVRGEFIRQYSPADLRAPASIVRTKLQTGQCTMSHFTTVGRYEHAFRNLLRECPDMSVPDRIHWFISGLSPAFKRHCATRPDGTDWADLAALTQHALGVEARENAATAVTAPTSSASFSNPKRLHSAFAATPKVTKKARRDANKAKASPEAAPAEKVSIPASIPPGLRGLWVAASRNRWKDPTGKVYVDSDPAVFVTDVNAHKCLQCHRVQGTGEGQCKGHGYQGKPSGSGSGGGNRKSGGGGGRKTVV